MLTYTHVYRQRALIVPAILGGLIFTPRLPAQVGLGLAPMRLEMRLSPGRQQSGALTLTNDSLAKTRIRAEILDFFIDPTETPQFERAFPQESEYSCRQWLSLNPMETELEPGATTLVRYTIRVPQEVTERSYHCAAGFTTMPTAEEMTATGLKTAVRIVAALYAVVGNPAVEGGLKEIKLEYVSEVQQAGWFAVVVMENHGLMHFRPSGELTLLGAEGQVVETSTFHPIPVLPKREQRFLFPLKEPITRGKYTLRARVDLGTHEIQEATAAVIVRSPNP
ncbi:MAG: hypothetical protein HY236_05880 [Acidobacteria bacterium]|nr:hypothetical protein [Acidobacteriota bacterium]